MNDSREKVKIDKIKKNATYIEKVIQGKVDTILNKNKNTANHILKVEKMLKESSLRPFGLTINIYVYLIITVAFTFYTFNFSLHLLNNFIGAMILSGIAIITPYEILRTEVNIKRRAVRRHLPNFFLAMSQLLEATEDITIVLETMLPKVKNPIKKAIKEFLINYRKGKDLKDCINIFKSRFDNPLMIKFAEDIQNSIENGTNLKGLVEEYVMKAYNNEINYMERITENSGNLSGAIAVLAIFLYLVYKISIIKPELIYVLKYNTIGKLTVDIIIVLITIAAVIMRYSVSYQDSK